ncbi:GNAT family N-acetyltransferase [Microbacterium sp. NPDC089189]|uniref:GNAT family N-acetyltransferase n=1 Tax=Microbacterium sp. NPDC089189 TaxID=3154972 RepID=UPI00343E5F2B
MTTTHDVEFRPVLVPSDAHGADAADFRRMTAIRNDVYREISGFDDQRISPEELLPVYRPDEHQRRYLWLVLVGGEVAGRIGLDIPLEEGSRTAYGLIELSRSVWGRGVGTQAHALFETGARAAGRSILQTWVEHPAAAGEQLTPPTGFGHLPRDHAARFLLRHGYTLEQVVRVSAYDMGAPVADLRAHLAEAERAAAGYRVLQWTLPTPEAAVAGYAWMKSRMSTDAPSAGLVSDEEVWDDDRLRAHDARYIDGGRTMLVTAAEHIATGELCAFNELVIGTDGSAASSQEDTLVLASHRGHRLGMLVKAAGLLAWRDVAPRSPRVTTYNAEENRPMLDINEALGFVPRSYEGAWKKVLI